MNHSCDANCKVIQAHVIAADWILPRLAMFTNKNILKSQELTFDYGINGCNFDCYCGSTLCRRYDKLKNKN